MLYLYTPEDDFIAGKKYLVAVSSVLLLLGILEIISSLIALHDTSGHYIGGWYIGMICTIAGIRGTRLRGRHSLNWLSGLTILAWIISLIGSVIQNASYQFLKDLEACASYSTGAVNSCVNATLTGYTCQGNSDYFLNAQACEMSWVFDDNDTSDECSCVSSADTSECYNYENMNSCRDLLNNAPAAIHSCFVIGVLCVLTSSLLLTLITASTKNPRLLANDAEMEAAIQQQQNQEPTVVAAVAFSPAHDNNSSGAYILNPTEVIIVQPGTRDSEAYNEYQNKERNARANNNNSSNPTVVQSTAVVRGVVVQDN